jgi:hypothetical protein
VGAVQRRRLRFATLDEAVRDAEQLSAGGYEKAGNWDLTQCCHHLAVLMGWPIDGFPPFRFPRNVGVWLLKKTVAPGWLRRVLTTGVWPAGTPTDERTLTPPGGDEAEAVAELRRAVGRLLAHAGPFKESPLFGMLDKETLVKLHCLHTAHHLSFLVPKA